MILNDFGNWSGQLKSEFQWDAREGIHQSVKDIIQGNLLLDCRGIPRGMADEILDLIIAGFHYHLAY